MERTAGGSTQGETYMASAALSLHTKYRPTSFAEVLGQEHVIRSLKKAVKGKRAHSYLFTGPSGCGKTTLARILANSFAGQDATVANIQEVPAADHTGVDAMRAVATRALSMAIGASPIKAIILDECHRLSGAAWDVLLKPIEEPPAHVYWFLCSTNPSKIPTTIKTRCLCYDLRAVAEPLILGLLEAVVEAEALEVSQEVLEAVVDAAQGSPRQALTGLEACLYCETAVDARTVLRSAGQSKEVIDLCRFLLRAQGRSWPEAVKLVKALGDVDAESTRINVINYLAAVLLNSKSERQAAGILALMEPFRETYLASDKLAPLLYSLGLALGLDHA